MTWSDVTFGPVAERNMRRRFITPLDVEDAAGGVDFQFDVRSDMSRAAAWWVESDTPITITSGMSIP